MDRLIKWCIIGFVIVLGVLLFLWAWYAPPLGKFGFGDPGL